MTGPREITVAVDVMSGDNGPEVFMPAVLSALKKRPHLTILAVGDQSVIEPLVRESEPYRSGRLVIKHASEVVEMDERPQSALRNKRDSSMRVAINCVKEGLADSCMSAGNTGALMATARFVLKMLPGIERPAICTSIPSMVNDHVHMLDLGANVDTTEEHLYQFALMGSLLASVINDQEAPKVALLNIGEEAIKGNEQIRNAAPLLEADKQLNYIGFVEGDGIFFDDVDVIVSDGFVGNVALKTMEGTAKMITRHLERAFRRNLFTKLSAVMAKPVLADLKEGLDPRKHNGASLLGLRGIVVKSHGNADAVSFENAIGIAARLVEQDILTKMAAQFVRQKDEE